MWDGKGKVPVVIGSSSVDEHVAQPDVGTTLLSMDEWTEGRGGGRLILSYAFYDLTALYVIARVVGWLEDVRGLEGART